MLDIPETNMRLSSRTKIQSPPPPPPKKKRGRTVSAKRGNTTNISRPPSLPRLHPDFTQLEHYSTYIRMLFVNFSSAHNTSPVERIGKLRTLLLDAGLPPKQTPDSSDWQSHLLGFNAQHRSPEGCVLSPLLFKLHTRGCVLRDGENSTVSFWTDATIFGLITNTDENSYREELFFALERNYCSTSTNQCWC